MSTSPASMSPARRRLRRPTLAHSRRNAVVVAAALTAAAVGLSTAAASPSQAAQELSSQAVVATSSGATIFGSTVPAKPSVSDSAAVVLGVEFVSTKTTTVTAVRFYKGTRNKGLHVGKLWTSTGTLLATTNFSGETASGWQTANFASPVTIVAGRTYVASYTAPRGRYADDEQALSSARSVTRGDLTAIAGVYTYGGSFPTSTWNDSNYYVDVVTGSVAGIPEPTPAPSPTTTPTATPTTAPAPTPTPTATPTATPTTAPAPTPTPTATPTTAPAPIPLPAPTADSTVKPGAATTGVPAGTVLKASGSLTITQANAVIDGLDISGGVTVKAPGVVIKNSRIHGTGSYGLFVASGSVTIMDSEIYGGFENAIGFDNWTAIRVDIHSMTGDGVKLGSNVTLQDSWIHDLTPASGAHADGAQLQSGEKNVVVKHNVIDLASTPNANAALFIAPDLGPSTDGPLTITDNWLDGGNYTVYCVDGNNGQYFVKNITISDNRFGRHAQYGPSRINVPVTQSGNVWADTSAALAL